VKVVSLPVFMVVVVVLLLLCYFVCNLSGLADGKIPIPHCDEEGSPKREPFSTAGAPGV
jgi:Na+-transporting methylmalonyl-CoA/oxaloacetate decarboxylase gamma subunit